MTGNKKKKLWEIFSPPNVCLLFLFIIYYERSIHFILYYGLAFYYGLFKFFYGLICFYTFRHILICLKHKKGLELILKPLYIVLCNFTQNANFVQCLGVFLEILMINKKSIPLLTVQIECKRVFSVYLYTYIA